MIMTAFDRPTWLRLVAVLVAGLIVAATMAFAPSGLASAQPVSDTSPPDVIGIEIDDIAVLELKGAAVTVRVYARCAPGARYRDIYVQLTQRSGPGVASGFGGTDDFFCSGALETVDITVTADPFGRTFKRADALAEANIYTSYDGAGDVSASDAETIALRKRR
jgi:hypothetical protein